jgi:hypothetical protein
MERQASRSRLPFHFHAGLRSEGITSQTNREWPTERAPLRLRRGEFLPGNGPRALPLSQKAALPGGFRADVGHAYPALGRALQAQGKADEALAAFRSAADNLGDALGQDHPDYLAARQLAGLANQ